MLPVHPAKVPQGGPRHCTASRSVAAKAGGLLPAHAVWPTCHTLRLHIGSLSTALAYPPLPPHLTPNAAPLLPHPPGSNASFRCPVPMAQGLMADLRAYCITDVSASMERTR